MFRIRAIQGDGILAGKNIIAQVQSVVRTQFPAISGEDLSDITAPLGNNHLPGFRPILFVADDFSLVVQGFAILLYAPDLRFGFLDYISVASDKAGRGVGGSLYAHVRQEVRWLGGVGLFFECWPDDPAICHDTKELAYNRSLMRFYERHGARPVVNTKYESPLSEDDESPPSLMFDDLGRGMQFRKASARAIVRAILERRYSDVCSPAYVDKVVDSIQDDPVKLREPRYSRQPTPATVVLFPQAVPYAPLSLGVRGVLPATALG